MNMATATEIRPLNEIGEPPTASIGRFYDPEVEIPTGLETLRLARAVQEIEQPTLRKLHGIAAGRKLLSFAVGMPAHSLFPAGALAQIANERLLNDALALQYGLPSALLKERIVELMARRGVRCRSEQIFLTTGAQQGLNLIPHLLLDPGGQVLTEETIYEGFQTALRRFGPELLTVSTRASGPDLDEVEALLAAGARPALMYVIPDGHNPLGSSMTVENRERLVQLARRFRMPILEDDAYGFLSYGREAPPPLSALDDRWVLYLGSFSKILAPSLRVGWLVVPEGEIAVKLSALKHSSDLDSSTFSQHLIGKYLDSGAFPPHLFELRREYQRRRDTMLRALEQHFPEGVRWSRPNCGFYIWLELPRHIDTAELLRLAVATEGVSFSPGRAFAVGGNRHADHCLRLSFSPCSCEDIEEGMIRLSRLVQRYL